MAASEPFARPKPAFVYMVRCTGGTLYTGWTTDPAARREGPRLDAPPARGHEPFLGSPRAAPVNKTGFGRARRAENRNAVGCADIPG